ncbi:MAG: copper-binding protein [Pseudomonadota bacterium]|nr:copper-binding protein [Pseudomonadota bacterium]
MNKLMLMMFTSAALITANASAADSSGIVAAQPSQATGVPAAAQEATAGTDGEVRKVDKEAKKITLKHGEIKNLGMPPMTMVFQVKDPVMLEKVQTGDKVRFIAENQNGALVVTDIQPSK